MNKNLERAKDMLPAIILTILSMIQALALELFWTRVVEAEFLWEASFNAVLGWIQALAMFIGILLIWLVHVSFVLRFTWLPSLEDMVVPFFIGLLEFAMIDLLHPDFLGIWMLLLAGVIAVSVVASHFTMRRARREVENDYFFSQIGKAGLRDYRSSIALVSGLVLLGILLIVTGSPPLLAALAIVAALAALCYQFLQAKRYWMHSLLPSGPGSASDLPDDREN